MKSFKKFEKVKKEINIQTKKNLIDTKNRSVVTRGQGG